MAEQCTHETVHLSPAIRAVASALIGVHLLAVLGGVLVAPSGPWPIADGADMATPPHFAQAIMFGPDFAPGGAPGEMDLSLMGYLKGVKMTHNYHFISNRPPDFETKLEARLLDANGELLKTVHFPEEGRNFMAQHRQKIFADGLAEDVSVEPLPGENIPAPNQPVNTVKIWEPEEGRRAGIKDVAEHLIPRNRPVYGPSEWSMIVARSYARYLCREHGAASVEILRRTKPSIPPDVLFMETEPPAGAFEESVVSFGVFNAPAQEK